MPDYAGNSLLAAREISVAIGSQAFSDRVDTFDSDDYYRITLSGRSSLNLAVNGLSANANVQLLDRNGNTLRSSTNSTGIAESINQVLDANTYYIRVYQDSSSVSTDYTLNLNLQNSPKTDIFWRDYSTGANAIWFMGGTNNATITASTSLPSVATNWRVEGVADFNGDNRPDLLWRDYSSGANAVWFMGGTNNTTIIASTSLTSVGTNWHIEGTADFNGDNRPDLLWRDYSSGANAVWFMGGTSNTTIIASTSLTSVGTNWHIEGTADFNGDNRPDLLWRDYSSGANAVWFMGGTNNTTIIASTSLTSVGTNWHIEGTADFNGDNRPDLLWRDYSSGANAVWFMGGTNNTTLTSSTSLTSVSTNWQALPYIRYEEPLPIDLAGNTTNTAFNLGTLSGSGTFSDRLDSTDPNDYYQFTLASTSTVNLALNGLSANADIQLLSSNGTVIQGSYNSSSSTESIGTTLSAGTYYVQVYQSSGSTNYSLNLSVTASLGYQYYTFKYSYGSGQDYYTGYGYTDYGKYTTSQSLNDSTVNETGKYGSYQITGITNYTSGTATLNTVRVSSYYNSETSISYTPYSGSGSSGLGSEYGYVTSGDSNTYYGGKYYEADLGYQYYTFKYSYGSGQDYYTGYGYADYGKYTSNQSLNDAAVNETGKYGSYLITGITNYTSGTATLNTVRVSSYYNSETSISYTPYSGSGSSGLGSEYGYLTNGNSTTYYGGKYYEADFGYQYYTFKYSYGSGQDYYTGYGYTDYGKYTSNQTLNDTLANETGNYGFYQVTGITNYTSGTATLNTVRVSSYYNSETSISYTPYSGSGSSGLGSEYGYVTNGDSNTYYGGKSYEADFGYQYYTFKYSYGSGQDYYTGYGYTDYGKYTSNQTLNDTLANETGNYGSYLITGITNYTSGTATLNTVRVSSYYNSENSTSYTPYSGAGSTGLGSEVGYLTSAQTSSNDYFGGKYYEADVLSKTTDPLVSYGSVSGNNYIDTLLNPNYAYWNTNQNGGIITYSFYKSTAGRYYGSEIVSEVTDAIKVNVRQILATLESVIKVRFVEVEDTASSYGVLRYMFSNKPDYAYAYYPGSGVGGDVHLSSSYESDAYNRFSGGYGTHGYMSLIHETCHALGLKHPGDYNGSGTGTGPFLTGGDDNTTNSLMSYNFAGSAAITVMPYDIQALQYLYGAKSYNSLGTTYSFNSAYSYTIGNQSFGSTASQLKQTIWDSGGFDTFDFSMLSTSQSYRFDLREGGILTTQTAYNSYTYTAEGDGGSYKTTAFGTRIALGTVIENLVNSRSNDYIIANSASNLFTGYTIGTYVGNDIFDLTSSSDIVDLSNYNLANLSVSVSNGNLTIGLSSYGSLLINNYYGSSGSMKVLIGNSYYTYSTNSGWQIATT